jgi:ribonuclease HII
MSAAATTAVSDAPVNARHANYKLRYKDDEALEVGLDEAGRGCLFGRLYVGAVAFPKTAADFPDGGARLKEIKDSKVISKKKRAMLSEYIKSTAVAWSVSYAEAAEVDALNVLQADLACMHRALDSLSEKARVERVLVDGDHWRPYKDTEGYAIVDGDAQYVAIAAAGILAKVARDEWVESVVAANPDLQTKYKLGNNMGYGTAAHMEGLKAHGATLEHRRTFAPVAEAMGLPVKPRRFPKKAKKGTAATTVATPMISDADVFVAAETGGVWLGGDA